MSAVRSLPLRGAPIHLRRARAHDGPRLLRWRNDPEDRKASYRSGPVGEAEHREWLAEVLNDRRQLLYVAEVDRGDLGREPCGMARLRDTTGQTVEVSLGVARDYRRHGLGGRLLYMATQVAFAFAGCEHVLGAVRPDNAPSLKMFARAGYREVGRNGQAVYMRIDRPGK